MQGVKTMIAHISIGVRHVDRTLVQSRFYGFAQGEG